MLGEFCLSESGMEFVAQMRASSSLEEIENNLSETSEFKSILESGQSFPSDNFLDLTNELLRLKTPGTFISIEELSSLKLSIYTISDCVDFLESPEKGNYPHLRSISDQIILPVNMSGKIGAIMDEKGLIRDNASPELKNLRNEIHKKTLQNEKKIAQLMNTARSAGWTSADAEITLREGRLVIPVLSSHKRKVKGIIHDESATGQTAFLEPEECFELNNQIRELESAEKREIIRILTSFTDFLRPNINDLLRAFRFLAYIDFLRAKAKFAIQTASVKPFLTDNPSLNLINARHPLLLISHQAKGRDVVPLDLKLNQDHRILVISGPNAGGKSVCLKTVGLLQYMLQAGMLISCDPVSEMGIFQKIFIDIGDEQSLENDLSTYSSHLLNIKYFIENGQAETLFLIDEFGSGTDPLLGGAIAEASLEKLNEIRAYGVITTHYSNLKLLADKQAGIINGAMLFDHTKMQPLYRLSTGKPGSSFTFEIAEKIGFPKEILKNASIKTGITHLDFEKQLQELETEKLKLIKERQEFMVADEFLAEVTAKYERLSKELEEKRKLILEQTRQEAKTLLDDSNRMIENTIREIRESQAEKVKTNAARKVLENFSKEIATRDADGKANEKEASPISLVPGDWVLWLAQQKSGYIHRLKGKSAVVDFDGIKITVPVSELIPTSPLPRKKETALYGKSTLTNDLNEKAANFHLTIDVRGKTAEEALDIVKKYLDDAILLSIREINILHGKGGGVLRQVIRELLAGMKEIKSYSDENHDKGGSGITKVYLK